MTLATLIRILIAFLIGLLLGFVFRFFKRPKSAQYIPFEKSHYINCSFGKIHYLQLGDGPHLVLIHGLGASIYCWKYIIRHFSKNFRVTAIDLLGHGQSDMKADYEYTLDAQTDRLAEVLNELNIKSCKIVGCSMGAAISLWLAKKNPKLIEGIAAIGPAAHSKIVLFNLNLIWPLVHILKYILPTPELIRILHNRVVYNHKTVPAEDVFQHYVPYHKNPDAVVCFWKCHDTLRDPRLPNELKNLHVPTLILYGKRDKLVHRRYVQALLPMLPNSKLVVHPDGGHHLMVDDPRFVSSEISNFFGAT